MTAAPILADTFRAIAERAEGAMSVPDAPADPATFAATVAATVLPRIVTLGADDDAELSVLVRNRRIVRLIEVSPSDSWAGEADLPCDAGDDAFAQAFTATLFAVSGRGNARIGTRFVGGEDVPDTLAGYSAAKLTAAVQAALDAQGSDALHEFRDRWTGHARAWAGAEGGADVPYGYRVDVAWMEARLVDWSAAVPDDDGLHLHHVAVGGETPLEAVFAATKGQSCLVACAETAQFPRLYGELAVLRDLYRRG